jgi:hypothetical protein
MAEKKIEKRFTFATYVDAVTASQVALNNFDIKNVEFEEIKCGYDGHELRVPNTPLVLAAQFEGIRSTKDMTDYEFLTRHSGTSALTHLATDQLKWALKQPDWLFFATHPNTTIFENFRKDKEPKLDDEVEMLREKTIKGALDFLIPWLGLANESPAARTESECISDVHCAYFALKTAHDVYLNTKDPHGRPDVKQVSKDDVARQTTNAVGLLCVSGGHLEKHKKSFGALMTFYEDVFMAGPKTKGARQAGQYWGHAHALTTHVDPVENWFWQFAELAKRRGWLGTVVSKRGFRGDLRNEGIGSLGAFRIAMNALQGALTGKAVKDDVVEPVLFGAGLCFLYDHAELLACTGVGAINTDDLAARLRKVAEVPEDNEYIVALAMQAAARALLRICPEGALGGGGDTQLEECRRMAPKGYPHIRTNPRTDTDGRPGIHDSFGKLMVWDLPTVKERSIEIDPAVICDAQGALLPYEVALAKLKEKYNDFTEGPVELNAAGSEIAKVNEDAGLSFYSVVQQVFGEAGTLAFNDLKRIEKEDSCYTQINKKGVEVGELPMSLEFSIGSKTYTGVFLGSFENREIAEASAEPILKGAGAWCVYNSYSECGKQSWLSYRGLLGKHDELRVTEWDPKKDLKPGMYQDFVDFCWEVMDVDKWPHELCRYDGIGQVYYVDLQSPGDEASPTHAWGIWRV